MIVKQFGEPCYKITFLGCVKVGKTAIINRFINKSYCPDYYQTKAIESYVTHLNLSEEEVLKKTYVNLIIEDTFGINNSILNKSPELITSEKMKKERLRMSTQFKNIMFTSSIKKDSILEEKRKKINTRNKKVDMNEEILKDSLGYGSSFIERNGFVFVCDCVKENTMETVFKLIENMNKIEKSNNLIYPKMILFNMMDKVSEKEFYKFIENKVNVIENYRSKYKIDIFRVSALTGQGIEDSIKKFVRGIHQEISNASQNNGVEEQEEDDAVNFNPDFVDKLNSCTKNIMCGNRIFSCGQNSGSEDESDS